MCKITKVLTIVVLALWGLATTHCDLEQLPGFEFLSWCHSEESPAEQDDGCGGDACSVVESGLYKVEEQALTVAPPQWVICFVPTPQQEPTLPAIAARSALLNELPPELSRAWQFFYRTALPPRAPSIVA